MVGMEPHLILRTSIAAAAGETTTSPTPAAVGDSSVNDAAAAGAATPTIVNIVGDDLGTVGNLLVDRAVGATLYTCTPGEYGRVGSDVLVNRLCQHLNSKGRNSYGIPVGGSNGLGSWGYIQGVDELVQQLQQADEALSVDHVVFASGSGGTAAGIAIGLALAYGGGVSTSDGSARRKRPQVHAVGVCDSPDYFYGQVAKIAAEMGLVVLQDRTLDDFVREHLTVHQGKGLGYAVSTPDELAFVASFARDTGVLLDPVYSGKALYQFVQLVKQDPESYRDQTILFWHTGGTLGLYDKVDDASFLDRLKAGSPCHRLDVYGKGIGVDASRDVG
jgi:1-aminocyclopropane-1-carboxylate deaminase/D-cysteine desulfhydrase-like pyridoxal-dependent ACC family enzyme